jgi:hypothetical protein
MKNVRILSDSLREYLERFEIGYPFENIHEMAVEDEYEEDEIFDDDEDDTSDDYLNY